MGLAANGIIRQAADTERRGEAFTIDGGGKWLLLAEAVTTGNSHLEGATVDGAPWVNITSSAITAAGAQAVDLGDALEYRIAGNNANARGSFRLLPTVAGQGGPIAA